MELFLNPIQWRKGIDMLPSVDFFGTSVTRLILGDNPFTGHSYIPDLATGSEMIDYYTADRIVRTLFAAEEAGLNTCLPLADPFILRVLRQYRNEGGRMHFIFQPYPAIDLQVNLRQMLELAPIAIYHQGTTTDGLIEAGQEDALLRNLELLASTGLPVGLGTHVPETILRSETLHWPVDFYMACLHNTRKRGAEPSAFLTGREKTIRFHPEDRPLMFEVIQKVNKPCLAFKVFAGGQVFLKKSAAEVSETARTVLTETYHSIKPGDLAVVGVYQKNKDQLAENARLAAEILQEAR